jgi:hypothetical protein
VAVALTSHHFAVESLRYLALFHSAYPEQTALLVWVVVFEKQGGLPLGSYATAEGDSPSVSSGHHLDGQARWQADCLGEAARSC